MTRAQSLQHRAEEELRRARRAFEAEAKPLLEKTKSMEAKLRQAEARAAKAEVCILLLM